MNGAQRRAAPKEGGSVRLEGGPMHGYVVKPNAPVLQPEWLPFDQVRRGQYSEPEADEKGLLVATWAPD